MYKSLRVLAGIPAYDEESKIGDVVRRVPRDIVDEVLVVDDGSTDGTVQVARDLGTTAVAPRVRHLFLAQPRGGMLSRRASVG